MALASKIVITGGAGLIGQNLIVRLKAAGAARLVAIDKHAHNADVLRRLHPDVEVITADLSRDDGWQAALQGADALVIAHAQIGGIDEAQFIANNITATERLLAVAVQAGIARVVHLSSSVVNSQAVDYYTETKKAQEALVAASGLRHVVLRPTLMFGWFDRKHLGWLARFMQRVPVFPIPGDGRFQRQPLYAGDLCAIILACLQGEVRSGAYNISGRAIVDYIDLIRAIRRAISSRTLIIKIPYWFFHFLLWLYARFDADPPFTTRQLAALVIPEVFEVIDWPAIFGVRATPLDEALRETFCAKPYCDVELQF